MLVGQKCHLSLLMIPFTAWKYYYDLDVTTEWSAAGEARAGMEAWFTQGTIMNIIILKQDLTKSLSSHVQEYTETIKTIANNHTNYAWHTYDVHQYNNTAST